MELKIAIALVNDRTMVVRGIQAATGIRPMLVTQGRGPGRREVVLEARTMSDLGVGIGDDVDVGNFEQQQTMHVVGEAVLAGAADAPQAGWGAAITMDDFESLGLDVDSDHAAVVSVKDGVDIDAFADRIADETGTRPETARQPVELARLRQVQVFPWALAVFLGTIGLVALVHAGAVIAAQRRKDLAVFRALGMTPGGITRSLIVATAVPVLAGALIGLPLGVLVGWALWREIARPLGVVVVVNTAWVLIVIVVLAAIVALAGAALLPVRSAARTRPAKALRAE